MSVNTWAMLQQLFIIYCFFYCFFAFAAVILSFTAVDVFDNKGMLRLTVALLSVVTVFVLIGGFLWYKNVETQCLYNDSYDSDKCIDKEKMS